MVQFRQLFPELRHFEKNGTRHFFFRSAAILKVQVRPNWFSNSSEPWVKGSRHANFGAIQAIFLLLSWSQHRCQHSCQHSCQGRGQRSNGAIHRNKQFSSRWGVRVRVRVKWVRAAQPCSPAYTAPWTCQHYVLHTLPSSSAQKCLRQPVMATAPKSTY